MFLKNGRGTVGIKNGGVNFTLIERKLYSEWGKLQFL